VLYVNVCKWYPAETAYVRLPPEAGEEEEHLKRKCGIVCSGDHGFTPLEIEV
jgi:hypothetical protein